MFPLLNGRGRTAAYLTRLMLLHQFPVEALQLLIMLSMVMVFLGILKPGF